MLVTQNALSKVIERANKKFEELGLSLLPDEVYRTDHASRYRSNCFQRADLGVLEDLPQVSVSTVKQIFYKRGYRRVNGFWKFLLTPAQGSCEFAVQQHPDRIDWTNMVLVYETPAEIGVQKGFCRY